MDDISFLNKIPRGKTDAPILLMQSAEITMHCDKPDSPLSMLDRSFSGCAAFSFSKPLNKKIKGKVFLDGRTMSYTHHFVNYMGGMHFVAVYLFPYMDIYDHKYTLHIEGFTDTDGNVMKPQDVCVRTLPKSLPEDAFRKREAVALQVAEEGIVLLKNNDVLPLKESTLNVFGIGLHLFRDSAVGAGSINSRYTIGFKRAIREHADFKLNEALADFYKQGDDILPSALLIEDALKQSDIAIVILSRFGGENTDASSAKGEYYLSDGEDAMLQFITKHFRKTVLVLNTPSPIDLKFVQQYGVDAVLYTSFGGMLGGQALLNILSGEANPSGKLTDTWAVDYNDIPSSKNFYDCAKDGPRYGADDADVWIDTVYEEDIYVGYRYFDTFNIKPAYCFGHGLSYTTFALQNSNFAFNTEVGLTLSVEVQNTGTLSGKEVVQLYVGKPSDKLEQPAKELLGFEKTKLLEPKQEQLINFCVPLRHLTSYDEVSSAYVALSGTYSVYIGSSLEKIKKIGTFNIEQEIIVKQAKTRMKPVQDFCKLSQKDVKATFPKGKLSGVKQGVNQLTPLRKIHYNSPSVECKPALEAIFSEVQKNFSLSQQYVSKLSVTQLCRLCVCAKAEWNMAMNGVAGKLAVPSGSDIVAFTVADGNSSVRTDPSGTGFPATTVYGATFNRQLIGEVGTILGEEAQERNVSLILAPGMNLHRNPLNGRNPEYFSEDPYLTAVLAAAYVEGMSKTGTGTCYKHILANNCETSRKRNQSIISQRAIRELYFKSFELAMEICMPTSVMTSYNAVNGTFTAADPELLGGLLREENNFNGCIMTDWNSYDTCDPVQMMNAGNSWLTPGSVDDKYVSILEKAVEEGKLTLETLRENVAYLVEMAAKLSV